MHIVIHNTLHAVDAEQWNALLPCNNPFMRYEFLYGLEKTGCVNIDTGWQPSHIAIYTNQQCGTLLAAMPCYIKTHSYGEYIFDWAWADAYHHYGIAYYPKLLNSVPFTPATGPRWLVNIKHQKACESALLQTVKKLLTEQQLSSFHSLFIPEHQNQYLTKQNYLRRVSNQFHWHNNQYQNFNDFLLSLNSKKRKNIKRERRRVQQNSITYHWFTGQQIDSSHSNLMHQFYLKTIAYYGAQAYLNLDFFNYLVKHFSNHTLFLFAYHEGTAIAGGLYFKSDDTLYGRYWGALDNYHSVHFETCYYQAIEWCINNQYQHFEAGAQGEHKLARGLVPTTTYSSHWIQHPKFCDAISHYVDQEQQQLEQYAQHMAKHSPFRNEV